MPEARCCSRWKAADIDGLWPAHGGCRQVPKRSAFRRQSAAPESALPPGHAYPPTPPFHEPVRRPSDGFRALYKHAASSRSRRIWTRKKAHEPQRRPPLCACGLKDLRRFHDRLRRRILQPAPGAQAQCQAQMQTLSDPPTAPHANRRRPQHAYGQPAAPTDALCLRS